MEEKEGGYPKTELKADLKMRDYSRFGEEEECVHFAGEKTIF